MYEIKTEVNSDSTKNIEYNNTLGDIYYIKGNININSFFNKAVTIIINNNDIMIFF